METQSPPRILVADDDPDNVHLIQRTLVREGYVVSAEADGPSALAHARSERPDLVLLDVNMPGDNGYAVCRAIQSLGTDAPAVIFLTGNTDVTARVIGLEAGAVDYITKPFAPMELLARVRAALRTKTLRDTLAMEARVDVLTGLFSRRHLDERASELLTLARRHGRAVACLMLDVDHFKTVNDTYGHAAGDAVLRHVALTIRNVCRTTDIAGRYGGDEFSVFLPETDGTSATTVAEKLLKSVAATPHSIGSPAPDSDDQRAIAIHVSVGCAWSPTGSADLPTPYGAADGALYRAKQLGRNRVVAVQAGREMARAAEGS